MDEWTGKPDMQQLKEIRKALNQLFRECLKN